MAMPVRAGATTIPRPSSAVWRGDGCCWTSPGLHGDAGFLLVYQRTLIQSKKIFIASSLARVTSYNIHVITEGLPIRLVSKNINSK